MDWVDKVGRRLRQIHRIREDLGDHLSPIDDIYRPIGMPRLVYQRKMRLLRRWEADAASILEHHWSKYIEKEKRNAIKRENAAR